MKQKCCSRCKEVKFLSEFYVDRGSPDGKCYYCKTCSNETKKAYLLRHNIKQRGNAESSKKWKLKNPDKEKQYRDKWKKENSDIEKYHNRIHIALMRGMIEKGDNCFICKKDKPLQAHHRDYNKSLEVMWLCHSCHQLIHHYSQCPSLEGFIPQKKVEVIGSTING